MRKGEIVKHGIDQNNFGDIKKIQNFNKQKIIWYKKACN